MGSPKKVMCRETGEIIVINAETCPEWKTKYLHCSGAEFAVPVEEVVEECAKECAKECEEGCPAEECEELEEESELEYLQAEYLEKIGKLPPRYKNDPIWLAAKLDEMEE